MSHNDLHNYHRIDGLMPGHQPACFRLHERFSSSAVAHKQVSQPLLSWSTDLLSGHLTLLECCAGDGAANVIPETVEIKGGLRGLSEQHFHHLTRRSTEVGDIAGPP